jgi:hypothetical protein
MNQLDADIRRFFARRIVRGAILLALLIAVIAVTVPTVRGHPPRNDGSQFQVRVGTGPDGQPVYAPALSSGDTRIAVGKSLADTLQGVSIVMIFMSVVLGASFVGAEFHLGSLTSQLLYEPRRWRVHASKATTAALGCALFTAFLCVVIGAMIFAGSELHGVVRGIDASWWRHRLVQLERATAASAAAGIMAYAVAVISRRTSAAIVAFFIMYPIIGIIRSNVPVFGVLSKFAPLRGLLSVAVDPLGRSNDGGDLLTRTTAGGIALTVVWAVVLLAASGALFARSEVR